MKKTALLLLASFALVGCKSTTPQSQAPQTQEQVVDEFAKVSSAMQAGRPVQCTMSKVDGSSTIDYKMMGKKMRISGISVEGSQVHSAMLSDGTMMYTWDIDKKTGMKFKLPQEQDLEQFAKEKGQEIPSLSTEADKKKFEDEGYRVTCEEKSLSADEFVPPADVKFTDTSAMMENVNSMMKKAPTGEAPSQEQINEMMKQYRGQ